MKFCHHEMQIELSDDWWAEAEMAGFVPTSKSYRVDQSFSKIRQIHEICIEHVGPVRCLPGVGIFNNSSW